MGGVIGSARHTRASGANETEPCPLHAGAEPSRRLVSMRYFTVHPLCHKTSLPPHRTASESAVARRPWAPFGVSALQLGDLTARPGKLSTIPHTHAPLKKRVIASTHSAFFSLHREPFLPPTYMRQWQQGGEEARVNDTGTHGTRWDVLVVTPTHHSDCTPTQRNTASRGCFHPPTLACLLAEDSHDVDKALLI